MELYWFRAPDIWPLFVWLLNLALVTFGGWLIARHAFDLFPRERLIVGFGLGVIIQLWAVNLFGRWIPAAGVFWFAAIFVLVLGLMLSRGSTQPLLDVQDLKIGNLAWVFFISGWLFFQISQGTGLFDEYKNLALISILGNNQIPPLAIVDVDQNLFYHYGFHFFGAGMMRLGNMQPWSAFDLSKAILWGYAATVAGLLGLRLFGNTLGAWITGLSITIAGGTRYILLFLPMELLIKIDGLVAGASKSLGVGTPLLANLFSTWQIDAGPPVGYPFAFLSGIKRSFLMAHQGSTLIDVGILITFILICTRPLYKRSVPILVFIFSYWALAMEASFALVTLAIGIFAVVQLIRPMPGIDKSHITLIFIAALLSSIFVFPQGGPFSEMIYRSSAAGAISSSILGVETDVIIHLDPFSFQWPPGFMTSQIGFLPATSFWALFVAVLEMGPLVLLLPWITIIVYRTKENDALPLQRLLILMTWLGLVIGLFVRLSSLEDIARIPALALDIFVIVALAVVGQEVRSGWRNSLLSRLVLLCLTLMIVSGLALGLTSLTASPVTIYSDNINDEHARLSQLVWGKLPQGSRILGQVGTPTILTGQLTGGIYSVYFPERRQLLSEPTLAGLLDESFEFVYVDSYWWNGLSPQAQAELQANCISVFAEAYGDTDAAFAQILDLRACYDTDGE